MFEAAGEYAWRPAPDPEIAAAEQALVRPLAVACCDLTPAVDRVVSWDDAPEVWPTMRSKTVFTR